MKKILSIVVLVSLGWTVNAQDKADEDAVKKIRKEGLENSKVMDIAFHLTDASGPRLQGSPGFKRAAKYSQDKLKEWGLENVQLEPWGEFGKGWELQKCYVAMTAPYYKPIVALPKVWTAGSGGLRQAEVLLVDEQDTTGLVQYKGKFNNKVVLLYSDAKLPSGFNPDVKRYTDEELEKMAKAEIQARPGGPGGGRDNAEFREMIANMRRASYVSNKTKEMARAEGAITFISINARGKDGTLFVQGGGSFKASDPENMLDMVMSTEDYLTIVRLAKAGIPVKLELDVQSKFYTDDLKGYNVLAEIKGTDPKLKDEVVMLGAHLDSWHTGTGATDNAAGSSVMLEAVRILKASGLKPKEPSG
ncbi:MAG: M28 family peptidase [Leadbetterella sp.]|nr:M28 family peptidase [Leadbetterella sp.]